MTMTDMKKTYFTPSIMFASTELKSMIAVGSTPSSGEGETGEHGDTKTAFPTIWENDEKEEEK